MQGSLFTDDVLRPAGEKILAPIRERAKGCQKCKLAKFRSKVVFGVGRVDKPDLAIVGEAPGIDENQSGLPFVGRSGQLLDKMLAAIEYTREQVYICNVLNCRPPNNREPEADELVACGEYLIGQLRAVRPKIILVLGGFATKHLLNSKKGITEMRGKWVEWDGVPVMPTFHPNHLLRARGDELRLRKSEVWSDLKKVLVRLGTL